MTLCFIIENSRMWKTQRHKRYQMTIDTNSYEETKKHKQLWKNKRQTIMKYQEAPFGLPLLTDCRSIDPIGIYSIPIDIDLGYTF